MSDVKKGVTWTEEEINILKSNYLKYQDKELCVLLPNRTNQAIYAKRQKLGLNKRIYSKPTKKKKEFNIEEDKSICEKYNNIYVKTRRENDKYNKSQIYIDFICSKHKEKGIQTALKYNLKKRKCCRFCNRYKPPKNEVLDDLKQINPQIEILSDFNGVMNKVDYICNIHNYKSNKELRALLKGKGCPYCGFEKLSKSKCHTKDDAETVLKKNNPNIIILDDYVSGVYSYNLQCKKCGHIWFGKIYSTHTCPNCERFYKCEQIVGEILTDNNIQFIFQKRFDECRDKKTLPFDYYLPKNNICIEYQGRQHYMSNKHFDGEKGFIIRQKHDQIKRDYCKDNGITLIEIPYTYDTREKIEDFLKDKIT